MATNWVRTQPLTIRKRNDNVWQEITQTPSRKKHKSERPSEYIGRGSYGYCNWEKGTSDPRPDKLRRLAMFFDVNIDSLYEEEKKIKEQGYPKKERNLTIDLLESLSTVRTRNRELRKCIDAMERENSVPTRKRKKGKKKRKELLQNKVDEAAIAYELQQGFRNWCVANQESNKTLTEQYYEGLIRSFSFDDPVHRMAKSLNKD